MFYKNFFNRLSRAAPEIFLEVEKTNSSLEHVLFYLVAHNLALKFHDQSPYLISIKFYKIL
jgi:hypothetical protein